MLAISLDPLKIFGYIVESASKEMQKIINIK